MCIHHYFTDSFSVLAGGLEPPSLCLDKGMLLGSIQSLMQLVHAAFSLAIKDLNVKLISNFHWC